MKNIWGKILGGAIGFAMGGPIGALVGAAGGHMLDWMQQAPETGDDQNGDTQQVAFTIAIIALSAKMAKADGRVTDDEVAKFYELCQVPDEERANVGRVFAQAQKDSFGYDAYAKQMAGLYKNQPQILQELLWILAQIAHADNEIHENEKRILEDIAKIFNIPHDDYERITELVNSANACNPYRVLGVSPEASDADIKTAYRKLAREHHPDLLIAKGMPEDFIAFSTQKLAGINNAYEQIKKERNIT